MIFKKKIIKNLRINKMSVDNIGSFYTNGVEPRSIRTVIATPSVTTFPEGGIVSYSGLFGAGCLITNITSMGPLALANPCVISAAGNDNTLDDTILTFATATVTTISSTGDQFGVTLPQDSWLVSTSIEGDDVPNLLVSYLS
jgi:hypothetical protein